jgi:hypothetical protein
MSIPIIGTLDTDRNKLECPSCDKVAHWESGKGSEAIEETWNDPQREIRQLNQALIGAVAECNYWMNLYKDSSARILTDNFYWITKERDYHKKQAEKLRKDRDHWKAMCEQFHAEQEKTKQEPTTDGHSNIFP